MGFLDSLNNPRAQLGLRMLAGNRWNSNVGQAFGQAALGQQEDAQRQQDDAMRRQLIQAQIAKMNAPQEDNSPLVMVMGPDGKPQFARSSGAAGMTPYEKPQGSASATGDVQEYETAKATGYKGGYLDFVRDRARAGHIPGPGTQPNIPQGYRLSASGDRYEFIPGGPADPAVIAQRNPSAVTDGMNERQRSGVNMQTESAIMYAANLTKKTPEEIRQVLAEKGPDGVKELMLNDGNRFFQGGRARAFQKLPLGQLAIDSANSDLIAPVKSGGAGIALFQNPTGAITGPDFQAGESQMPNALYPLDTQAEMVRQMLIKASGSPSQPTAQPSQGGNRVRVDLKGNVVQ